MYLLSLPLKPAKIEILNVATSSTASVTSDLLVFFRVVEMTGDIAPDMRAIASADLIVTTPEKWDGVSRSWQNRNYVQKVTLVIIDEIHLLGLCFICIYFIDVTAFDLWDFSRLLLLFLAEITCKTFHFEIFIWTTIWLVFPFFR